MIFRGLISRAATYCILLLSLLVLNACTQVGTTQPGIDKPGITAVDKTRAWNKRQQFIARKPAWNLRSKISLRYDDENWIFGLKWAQQAAARYVMQVTNPLTGGLVARLSKNAQGVSLLSDDGKIYRDNNEERLLQSQTNLSLPVKGLQYWVRGVTAPQYKVEKLILDSSGRPRTIYQAGWKINYSRYTSNQFNAMPRKILLTRSKDNLYLKVIAKQWQGI